MSQILVIDNNGKYQYFSNDAAGRSAYCAEMSRLLGREFHDFEIDQTPVANESNNYGGVSYVK